jgi:hypothetical protein
LPKKPPQNPLMIRIRTSFSEFGLLWFALLALFTAMIFRVILLHSVSKETIGKEIQILVSLMWVTFILLQFKALRKASVFTGWFILALVHLGMFIWLYNDTFMSYSDEYGITRNYSRLLIVPVLLLLLFQACRKFSLAFYNKELEPLGRFGQVISENRRGNGIEIACDLGMFLIMAVSIYLCYFS